MKQQAKLLLGLTGLEIDGGVSSVARCITRALEEWSRERAGSRVDRVSLLDPPDAPPAPCGEQRLAGGRQALFPWHLWRLYRRHRHDLVFFDHLGLTRSVRLPLPGFPPPCYTVFVHGGELVAATSGSRAAGVRGAWRILVNSPFTARRVAEQFPEQASRIRVTFLCIDPEKLARWQREAPVADPGPRRPAAIIVGRMWAEERGKGHDDLLQAWPTVRRAVPEAELWIVGQGDDQPRLERLAGELGLADCVRFLGRVSDEELGGLYRQASVLAMPSRQEGFGLVYAEAMWHGLPCIGSTADAAGSVIDDGSTGHLVPYGDPEALARRLGEVLGKPEQVARMGDAARRVAATRFGYARFRSDLLEALELDAAGPSARERTA